VGRDSEAIAALRDLNPTGLYKLLPMSSGAPLPSGAVAQIMSHPQVPFRPTRLLVSRHSSMFLINDIRLSTRSMFAQSGDVPADLFAGDYDSLEAPIQGELIDGLWTIRCPPRAVPLMGLPIAMPEAAVGQEIIVLVTNAGVDEREFRGAFLGFARYH
jgi:hypothetical protein